MNKKFLLLLMAIAFSLLESCSGASTIQPVQSTSTVLPPVFASTETPASTPTILQTPIITQKISKACVKLDLENKSKVPLKAVVVFHNFSQEFVNTIFLRDLEKPNIKLIKNTGPIKNFWGISLDRKYLLYEYDTLSNDEYYLAMTDASGKPVKEFDNVFPNDPYSADYYNWQNNQNIRVVLLSESREGYKASPRVYNPFTGDYRVLKTDFPDYVGKDIDWRLDWFALSTGHLEGANIVYDPSLTRVLYPKEGEIVSLINVESGKELASIHLPNWGRLPKWSPDGNYLALIGTAKNSDSATEEIYVVPRDGNEFKRLTYFSNTFNQSAIADYGWSPDGKHIAFLIHTDLGDPKTEGLQSELMVLDVQTGDVTDLCIQGIGAVTHLSDVVLFASLEPIWSPDGHQIMISQWEAPGDEKNRNYNVLVVDLPSLTAVKIDENKQPVGWMTKGP